MIAVDDRMPQIEDERAYEAAVNRAASLFATEHLKTCAKLAASVHVRAADYIEQAPVLALFVMAGGGKLHGGRANRLYAAHKFGGLCESGAKLREVMRAYGVPLPMRAIKAKALRHEFEGTLAGLAKLNPSTISQIIPRSIVAQKRWLAAYRAFRERLAHSCTDPNTHAAWAAVQIAEHRVSWGAAADVADFAAMGDQPINPTWSWERAQQAARDWHDRLSAGDAKRHFGVMAYEIVDLGDHPDHLVVEGLEFVALRTPAAIHAEGCYMRHCVSSYVSYVINGVASIVSVQCNEQRIATLELRQGRIAQLKGRFNAAPSIETRRAAEAYVATLRLARDLKRHVGGGAA